MGSADRAQLIAELLLDDKFTKPLNRIDKRLGAFSGAVNRNVGRGIDNAVSAVARGVVRVGKGVANAAIDWEDAFQGVVKTVDATPKQFDEISDSLRRMSTEMPNTALELAGIAEQGGAMGIKAKDIEAFTKQVAILASTTDIGAQDAATALGQLQNVIGLTGDEFDNFAAALVDLGNKGSSTESQILEIARRAGGAAKLFGISKDSILGWSAAAANLGLNSELAGTALQNVFVKLLPQVGKGGKLIQKIFGRSAKDIRKLFAKDASGSLEIFIRKLAKLPKQARLQAIQKMFGKGTGITRLLLGLTGDVKGLDDALDDSTVAWKDATAAQAEFDKRNATVKSAIQRLKNGLFDAAVTVGEGFAPAIGRAADKLSEFLKLPENRTALKNLGQDVGRLIDKVDWDELLSNARSFMSALEKAGGFANALWDTFSSIPADAKAVLISLAGLNKLSGGAVSGLFKDAFGQLFSRGSSPANPLWVQSVGGGTGGPGVPGVPIPGGGTPGVPGGIIKPPVGAVVGLDPESKAKLDKNAQAFADAVRQNGKDNRSFIERFLDPTGKNNPNKPVSGQGQIPGAPGGGPHSGHTGTMQGWAAGRDAWSTPIRELQAKAVTGFDIVKKSTDDVGEIGRQGKIAIDRSRDATTLGTGRTTSAVGAASGAIVGAVRASRDQWYIETNVYVSGNDVTGKQTNVSRVSQPSSKTNDERHFG